MPNYNEQVEQVEQIDREAFRSIILHDNGPLISKMLSDGAWDKDPRMLAIVAHRLAVEPEPSAPCAVCGKGEGYNLHAPFGDEWHEYHAVEPDEGLAPVAYRYVHFDYAGRKVSRYGASPARVNGHDPIEVHPLYAHPPSNRTQALEEAIEPLQQCANRFWEYVISHQGKRTPEGDEKAQRNKEMAEMCEAAIRALKGEQA